MTARSAVLDAPRVVQFLHPGREHRPDEGRSFRTWNTGPHRRKFMEHHGRALDLAGRVIDGPLRFWAEYEPPTSVEALAGSSSPGSPAFLHRIAPMGRRPERGQNTDPWIFGGFFYSNCQQWRKTGSTALTELADQSVILFGSHLDGDFVLDTCFVVDSSDAYDRKSVSKDWDFPPGFREAVLEPLGCGVGTCGRGDEKRLYRGAEHANGPARPFSFVPCVPSNGSTFARPVIRGSYISSDQKQGYGFFFDPGSVWADVREQVLGSGLLLGVRIDPLQP